MFVELQVTKSFLLPSHFFESIYNNKQYQVISTFITRDYKTLTYQVYLKNHVMI